MNGSIAGDDGAAGIAPDQVVPGRRRGSPARRDDEPPEPGLSADIASAGTGVTVLSLAGDIDLASAESFATMVHDGLSAGAGGRVVLELNRVTFLSARGLGVLVEAQRHAQRCGTDLVLVVDQVAPAARTLQFLTVDVRPRVCPLLTTAVQIHDDRG